jgi:hypothetical protein
LTPVTFPGGVRSAAPGGAAGGAVADGGDGGAVGVPPVELGGSGVTVTVDVADDALPDESVAVNRTVVVPTGNTLGAFVVIAGLAVTTSVAVADPRNAATRVSDEAIPEADVAATMIGAGAFTDGGAVSRTTTVPADVAVCPALSVAVHVTAVAPRAKVEPDVGVQVTGTGPSTASTAGGTANVTGVPPGPTASAEAVTEPANTGAVVSTTVTVNVPVTGVSSSVTVQVTVVAPSGNVEPDAGAQLTGSAFPPGFVAVAV